MIYLGSHYYLLILENPRHMTCRIYLSMACEVSSPAISKRWGEGARSYSLVKVSIYIRVGRSRQSCKLHTLKGVPFLNRRYKIGVPYPLKIVYKRGRGWAFAFITFLEDLSHRAFKKKKRNITLLPTGVLVLSISREVVACFRFWHFGEDTFSRASPRSESTFPRTSSRQLAWRNTSPRAFWLIFGWTLTISGTFHTLTASFSARAWVINWLLTTIDIEGLPRNKNKKSNIFILQTFKLITIFQQVS